MAIVAVATAVLLVHAVLRGQTLAGWRDGLVEAFAAQHLVPAVSVGMLHVSVGRVALGSAGGPAEVQRLWVAGRVPRREAHEAVLAWETVRLSPSWLDLTGTGPPARVEIRGLRLDLGRPDDALAALTTVRRLLAPSGEPREVELTVVDGVLRTGGGDGGTGLALGRLSGRAAADGAGGWTIALEGRSPGGGPLRLHLRARTTPGAVERVAVEIEAPGRPPERLVLPEPAPGR